MPTIADIIQQAAAQYGIPPEYLMRAAQLESGMNPAARNPNSSAGGLFQQIDSNWKQYGRGDRFDPVASADAAARFWRDNQAAYRKTFGSDPTGDQFYLMHQQGGQGGINLLRNPTQPASSVVSEDAIRLNAGQPGMTAGDFANLWTKKFGAGTQPVGSRAATAPDAAGAPGVAPLTPAAPTDGLGPLMAQLLSAQQPPAAEKPPEGGKKPKRNDMASIFANASPNLVLA
ncbi:MAG: transglycosylase SLT domain-containing protein [Luteitalea sp.]|nr:transglycosylase SLT domain-containing protein [Luteitalea sp.]